MCSGKMKPTATHDRRPSWGLSIPRKVSPAKVNKRYQGCYLPVIRSPLRQL